MSPIVSLLKYLRNIIKVEFLDINLTQKEYYSHTKHHKYNKFEKGKYINIFISKALDCSTWSYNKIYKYDSFESTKASIPAKEYNRIYNEKYKPFEYFALSKTLETRHIIDLDCFAIISKVEYDGFDYYLLFDSLSRNYFCLLENYNDYKEEKNKLCICSICIIKCEVIYFQGKLNYYALTDELEVADIVFDEKNRNWTIENYMTAKLPSAITKLDYTNLKETSLFIFDRKARKIILNISLSTWNNLHPMLRSVSNRKYKTKAYIPLQKIEYHD